jgi:thiamine-phosphate diphosphorylase
MVPTIHAVTTDDIVVRPDFVGLAAAVMRALGPRGAVHVRCGAATGRLMYDLAAALVPHQEATGAWLVVNDRLDVALCVGARGVQLTSRSLSLADAREVIAAAVPGAPHPAVGASIHSADEARDAAALSGAGISVNFPAWLVAGHVFTTPSHAGEAERGPSFLAEICAATSLPVIAIGGVRPADVAALLAAGAYGVAAIRGIWRAVDAERAAADYLSAYDAVRDARAIGRGGSGIRS